MTVNFNSVIRMMGLLLLVLGICMLPSIAVALIYHEMHEFLAFLCTIIPCFVLGFILIKVFRPSLIKLKNRDGFLIVTLCWLVASVIGALPFTISGAIPDYVDAFLKPVQVFPPQVLLY